MKITKDHSPAYIAILPYIVPYYGAKEKKVAISFGWLRFAWHLWL